MSDHDGELIHYRPETCRQCHRQGVAKRWFEEAHLPPSAWHFKPHDNCPNPDRCADRLESFDPDDKLIFVRVGSSE